MEISRRIFKKYFIVILLNSRLRMAWSYGNSFDQIMCCWLVFYVHVFAKTFQWCIRNIPQSTDHTAAKG